MRMLGRVFIEVKAAKVGIERTRKRLAARDEGSSSSTTIAIIISTDINFVLVDIGLDNVLDIANLNQDIFGLQVGVDDATFTVHVVETQQDLLGDLFYQGHGDASMIPSLDETQKILAQHLKHHADVHAVGPAMLKGIQQADDMFSSRMAWLGLDDLVEQLDFVDGRFRVVGGRADDLERDMAIRDRVSGQPDGRKMAPAQLADYDIAPVLVGLADAYGVVTACAVILGIFLLSCQQAFFVDRG